MKATLLTVRNIETVIEGDKYLKGVLRRLIVRGREEKIYYSPDANQETGNSIFFESFFNDYFTLPEDYDGVGWFDLKWRRHVIEIEE